MTDPGNTYSIKAISTLSALGSSQEAVVAYNEGKPALSLMEFGQDKFWAGRLPENLSKRIGQEIASDYPRLDLTVHYAMFCARDAMSRAGWETGGKNNLNIGNLGLNIGSSRGATGLWEHYHNQQLNKGRVGTQASPATTLGNIASWVAHDLGTRGPAFSHSITCSSALHAIINGCVWLKAGYTDHFLAGGSEAPLTPFTFSQMEALKIYSRLSGPYPCRSFDLEKTSNTMVLSEGAGMVCLEAGKHPDARAWISGFGYATEPLSHGASLSADAMCLQRSMKMALSSISPDDIGAVVVHAPGTLKGDSAEFSALEKVFPQGIPPVFTNKWQLGHSLGASGVLNLELGILLLEGNPVRQPGYLKAQPPKTLAGKSVLINAVGFGGNAVSLLIRRPD